MHSWALDSELAAGRSPDASSALRARVELLSSRRHRESLAESIEGVLFAARAPASRARVAPARDPVLANAPALRALAIRLRADAPMEPRGLASLTRMLTDWAGPVFAGANADAIAAVLARASEPIEDS